MLELEPEKLGEEEHDYLRQELQAWRYKDKFPKNRDDLLRWAQLEERRRVVRDLITRIDVAGTEDGERDTRPVLGLGITLKELESLAPGHRSLAYIEREESHYLKSLRGDWDGRGGA